MPPLPKHPQSLYIWRSLAIRQLRSPPVTVWGDTSYHFSSSDAATSREQSSKKMLICLLTVAGDMVGASYAAVPLYRRFCQATGYGGTIQRRESVEEKITRHTRDGTKATRELVVQFNADVVDGMPWNFVPTQRQARVKPGEKALAFYTAENHSSAPITGVSTYNVTPMKNGTMEEVKKIVATLNDGKVPSQDVCWFPSMFRQGICRGFAQVLASSMFHS